MNNTLSDPNLAQGAIENNNLDSSLNLESSSEIIFLLTLAFNQYDPDRSGFVDYREIADSILLHGMKFYDNEIFTLFDVYSKRSEGKIDFKEYLKLLEKVEMTYTNLREFSVNKMNYEVLLPKSHEDYSYSTYSINLDKIGFPQAKIHKIRQAFELIDNDGDGKITLEDIQAIIRLIDNDNSLDYKKYFFEKLDFENRGFISLENILRSIITKEGIMNIYNLLATAKNVAALKQSQIQGETIHINPIFLDNNSLMNLVEAFELFDIKGQLMIEKSFLQEYEGKLQSILDLHKLKVYKSILKNSPANIYLENLISYHNGKNAASKEILDIAKQFCNLTFFKSN